MIWESTLAMTIIDILIVGAVLVSGYTFYAHWHVLRDLKVHLAIVLIALGQVIFAVFYFTDLLTMTVFPFLMSANTAMRIMEKLHLEIVWIITLVGILCFSLGLTLLTRVLLFSKQTLEKLIAERELSENALRESESRYRRLYNETPVMMHTFDDEGRLSKVNDFWLKEMGYRREEVIGKHFAEFMPERHRKLVLGDGMPAFRRDGFSKNLPRQYIRKSGEVLDILISAVRVENERDGSHQNLAFISDITTRVRTERELRESQRLLQAVFDNIPQWIFVKDLENRYLMVNRAFADTYTIRPEEFIGTKPADISIGTEAEREVFRQADLKALETEAMVKIPDVEVTFPDGKIHLLDTIKMSLRDDEGEIVGVLGMTEDVTERKKIEAQLRLQAQIIEKTNECIITTDETGLITSWNAGAERLFGYTAKETIGKMKGEDMYPSHQQAFYRETVLGPAIEKGKQTLEVMMQKKSGQEFYGLLSLTILKNEKDEVIGRIGHTLDITERRNAEEALRSNERLLQTVFDTVPHWILVKDRDGKILMANKAMVESFQVEPKYFTGRMPGEIENVPEETRKLWRKTDLEVIRSGKGMDLQEYNVKLPGGVLRRGNLLKRPLIDDAGHITGIVGISQDLTAQKEAEEALRESEERFRAVAENTPVPVMMARLEDGVYLYANPAANRLLAGADGDLVGRKSTSFWMDARKRRDMIDRIHKEGRVVDLETQMRAGDGSVRWVVATTGEIRFQGESVLMTGLIDVTERKKAEDALRESERQIRLITDSVPAMIAYIDGEKRYRYINRHYQQWVGREADDILGKTMEEVMGGDVYKLVEPQVDQALSGNPVSYETEIPGAGSRDIHVLANYVPHVDQGGRTLGFYALVHDITEQKQAEEALKSWNETLEQRVAERTAALETAQEELVRKEKMATLGQLTATVSHELRNPLGTIRTSVFSILEKFPPDDKGIGKSLARIDRNVTRCDDIISDLLEFTRNRAPKPSSTDVGEWIAELMEEQRVPDWLKLDLNLAVKNRPVNFDQDYIRRALVNLYENALQALEALLENSKGKRPKITIAARIEKKWLKISVKDTGPGMTQEVLDKIFEPLFSTKTYGIGLGLPTVRQIMELNGGSVSIKSKVGNGTEAVLKLPLSLRPENEKAAPVA